MSWGAMMGLGQSLQQVGGMIGDYNKSKMRDRLEQERDQRKHELQLEKEARQEAQRLARPTEWKPVEIDGKWTGQAYNEDGTILTGVTKDLTPVEIEELRRKRDAAERQDKIDILKLGKEEFESGNLEEAWRMKQEEHRTRIDRDRAAAESSRARAMNAGRNNSDDDTSDLPAESDIVTTLMKDLGSYGDDVDRFAVEEAATEALAHARNVARKTGEIVDPLSYARIILRNRYGTTREVPAAPRGINWR